MSDDHAESSLNPKRLNPSRNLSQAPALIPTLNPAAAKGPTILKVLPPEPKRVLFQDLAVMLSTPTYIHITYINIYMHTRPRCGLKRSLGQQTVAD